VIYFIFLPPTHPRRPRAPARRGGGGERKKKKKKKKFKLK